MPAGARKKVPVPVASLCASASIATAPLAVSLAPLAMSMLAVACFSSTETGTPAKLWMSCNGLTSSESGTPSAKLLIWPSRLRSPACAWMVMALASIAAPLSTLIAALCGTTPLVNSSRMKPVASRRSVAARVTTPPPLPDGTALMAALAPISTVSASSVTLPALPVAWVVSSVLPAARATVFLSWPRSSEMPVSPA